MWAFIAAATSPRRCTFVASRHDSMSGWQAGRLIESAVTSEVPDQHARRVAENLVRGMGPGRRGCHDHVVMQQRGRGCAVNRQPRVECPGDPQRGDRREHQPAVAQALAATGDDVARRPWYQRTRGLSGGPDDPVHEWQVQLVSARASLQVMQRGRLVLGPHGSRPGRLWKWVVPLRDVRRLGAKSSSCLRKRAFDREGVRP